jgi:hypothetical protein
VIFDLLILLVVVVAVVVGFRRGTIQPLLAEIGLLVVVALVLSRWSGLFGGGLKVTSIVGGVLLLALAIVVPYAGWRVGGVIHRMPVVQGVDGLLGVFVQGLIAVLMCYFFVSAVIGLGDAFGPAVGGAALTPGQVAQMRRELAAHPLLAHLVDQRDLDTLARRARQPGGVHVAELPSLQQMDSAYVAVGEPQLRSSRLTPIVVAIGRHVPGFAHFIPAGVPAEVAKPSPSPRVNPSSQ